MPWSLRVELVSSGKSSFCCHTPSSAFHLTSRPPNFLFSLHLHQPRYFPLLDHHAPSWPLTPTSPFPLPSTSSASTFNSLPVRSCSKTVRPSQVPLLEPPR